MTRLRGAVLAAVAAVWLTTGVASAMVIGVVDAISKRDVTVAGVVYPIDADVAVQDMTGAPITLPEVRPGTHVELEVDDEGQLTTIRAAVVR